MEKIKNVKDILALDEQAAIIIQKGADIYNKLRNSSISICYGDFDGTLSLDDKKCLAMYISMIQNDNFFKDILTQLNYQKFTDFSTKDTSLYHFEEEYYSYLEKFDKEDFLEVLVLYLLEYPVIRQLNLKQGYCIAKMKLQVYDRLGNKIKDRMYQNEGTKNKTKVLTNI